MKGTHPAELFSRFDGNPILTAADCPHTVNAVFNPAAVRFEGETLLLVRVEDRRGISHLCVARSADEPAEVAPSLRFAGAAGRSHPLHILTQQPCRPPGARFTGVFAHYP